MKISKVVMVQFVFGVSSFLHHLENSNLLKFTVNKITKNSKNPGKLIKDKCVMRLIEETIEQFGTTYLLITDNIYHEELLQNLQINFVHSYFTEPSYLSYSKSDSFYNLQIFRKEFKLRDIIKKHEPFQSSKFFILVKNYEEIIEKFEVLWRSRLVNAVASFVINSTVYSYTYFPYSATHCGKVGKPYLLAQCDVSTGIFAHREKLFPKKVNNLHLCPIGVTFTENVPSSYYTDEKKLTGWEVDLINEILERINGVPNYKMLYIKTAVYRISEGYRRLVENSEIGGGLVVSLQSLAKTDFCMYGMSLCTTWIVPKKDPSPHSVDFLIKVFPPVVWLLLLLAYFIMASIIKIFSKAKYSNVLFKLLPYLMGTTTRTKKISRRIGIVWLLFCLVINAVYQSGYKSALLLPDTPNQLDTTKEILQSNLKILGVTDIMTDAAPFFKERFNFSSRRYRNRKISYENLVYRMTIKKDSAFLGFKETVLYHTDRTELAHKIYIPDYCIIKYLLAFVLKKNSHLTDMIVKLSNRLNENGFLSFFIRKHLSRVSKQNIPKKFTKFLKPIKAGESNELPPPINMDKIFVVFLCLTGGILLALMAFALEIMAKLDYNKIKRKFLKELQSAWTYKK